jgi:hypothetical protein
MHEIYSRKPVKIAEIPYKSLKIVPGRFGIIIAFSYYGYLIAEQLSGGFNEQR